MSGLAIVASGMMTAVGFNSPATCAALRAGIRNINQTNLWDPETGTFLAAGKVDLPQWWVGVGKLADLVAPAILECLTVAAPIAGEEIPVLLGVPAPDRPCRLAGLDTEIFGEIEERLGFPLHPGSRLVAADRVSVAIALARAAQILDRREARRVVVAAVDSLLQHDLEGYYLEQRRLLTPANSNGFALGEAGSALLVGPFERGCLEVLAIGLAEERATIESEEPLQAEGLTTAVRQALAEAGMSIEDIDYRITDLNGEHYRFKEMALAMDRFTRKPRARLFDLWHPIEYIGDVGAAIGPILLGWARDAGQKRYGNGPTVLCTMGNDNGLRAAVVVTSEMGRTAQ